MHGIWVSRKLKGLDLGTRSRMEKKKKLKNEEMDFMDVPKPKHLDCYGYGFLGSKEQW